MPDEACIVSGRYDTCRIGTCIGGKSTCLPSHIGNVSETIRVSCNAVSDHYNIVSLEFHFVYYFKFYGLLYHGIFTNFLKVIRSVRTITIVIWVSQSDPHFTIVIPIVVVVVPFASFL